MLIFVCAENLNNALGAIRVLGVELIADELKPHLNTVMTDIKEKSESVMLGSVLGRTFYFFFTCAVPFVSRERCCGAGGDQRRPADPGAVIEEQGASLSAHRQTSGRAGQGKYVRSATVKIILR